MLGVNIHMHTMATKRVHTWIDYITNDRPSHRSSVFVNIIQNITQRLQLADDQVAYMLTPFILAAWDLRSFYVEHIHQHLVDPRVQSVCVSVACAPKITLALSEACISGVDQSVRDMLLEWGTRHRSAPEWLVGRHSWWLP